MRLEAIQSTLVKATAPPSSSEASLLLGTLKAWFPNAKLDDFEAEVWKQEIRTIAMGPITDAMQAVKDSGTRFIPSLPELVDLTKPTATRYDSYLSHVNEALDALE